MASPEALGQLLVPAAADVLVGREVPNLVNNVREDGPALITERTEAPATLF